jgi:hypothetical protein
MLTQMTHVTCKTTKVILVTTVTLVIIVALFSVVFCSNQTANNPPTVDYWILDISSSNGGYVTPNGTIHVPMNQTGINVTATATGWNSFWYWKFDGEQMENQSSTIFMLKQQANSSHTLEATIIGGTPPLFVIVDEFVTVNASSYKSYNFAVPSDAATVNIDCTFAVSGSSENKIKVYIMDSTNFANWQNGQNASSYYNSGEATNSSISITLHSAGTYFIVYDNTFDTNTQKNIDTRVYFYYFPKD